MQQLVNFIIASQELSAALEADTKLDDTDRLQMENSLTALHIAYIEWRRRNVPPGQPSTVKPTPS